MILRIRRFQQKHPFLFIMVIALLVRLVAVVFSRGFLYNLDHFLLIETAQSWIDGRDYPIWLPWTPGNEGPSGTNMFFVLFHYMFLQLIHWLGIHDPQVKMLIVRVIHAFLSLLVVSFGYRMASLVSEKKTAYRLALLLAVFWFMPFISVRNMAEMVSAPFFMYGTLIILRQELIRRNHEPGYHLSSFMFAGFFLGLAFSVWYPALLYVVGLWAALLLMRNYKGMLSAAGGFLISSTLIQASIDLLLWRMPFAEFIAYVSNNFANIGNLSFQPWHYYPVVYLLALILPLSLMLLYGFFRGARQHFILFVPVALFILVHLFLPAKQFRYLLPVMPLFILLGLSGWDRMISISAFWRKNPRTHKALWAVFWVLNTTLLLWVTVMYPNRSRVETMRYLSQYEAVDHLLVDDSANETKRPMPLFYLKQWPGVKYLNAHQSYASFFEACDADEHPDFVLLYEDVHLAERVDSLQQYLPDLRLETRFKPGWTDRLILHLFPDTENKIIYVYRNTARQPLKKN